MNHITHCPLCNNHKHNAYITCVDYLVSRETFNIVSCENCGFKFTSPRPKAEDIGGYYKSPEYVSHSNSKKGLINILYQRVRQCTIKNKVKLILKHKASGSLLDIGCGTGEFLNACKNAGFSAFGIEPDSEARNFSKKNYNLNVNSTDALFDFSENQFDIITMWHVLEHVYNLKDDIQQIIKLLKPNGLLILALPNYESFDARHYKQHWAAYDVPRHLYHFSSKDINRILKMHNLELTKVLPMFFDSFYVSMLSEKHKTGNINYIKAFFVGLVSNINAMLSRKNKYSSQIYVIKKKQ